MGKIPSKQAYRLWNMGNGMLLICNKEIAGNILNEIEGSGFYGKAAGKVIEGDKISIRLKNDAVELIY